MRRHPSPPQHHHHHHLSFPASCNDNEITTTTTSMASAPEHHHHHSNVQIPMDLSSSPIEIDSSASSHSASSLLTVWQAALLLTADCLGTGLLALPQDIQVLGSVGGMIFLIGLLPINGYAGTLLSRAADTIEWNNYFYQQQQEQQLDHTHNNNDVKDNNTTNHSCLNEDDCSSNENPHNHSCPPPEKQHNTKTAHTATTTSNRSSYSKVQSSNAGEPDNHPTITIVAPNHETKNDPSGVVVSERIESISPPPPSPRNHQVVEVLSPKKNRLHKKNQPRYQSLTTTTTTTAATTSVINYTSSDDDDENDDDDIDESDSPEMITRTDDTRMNMTHDYTSITHCIFGNHNHHHYSFMTTLVAGIYYTNIFLVLGDYILVMAHAVQAFSGFCLPTAGILASTVMMGLAQLRTMNDLGHSVTALSLIALTIVVIQCLVGTKSAVAATTTTPSAVAEVTSNLSNDDSRVSSSSWIRKLSALASIGFATGPNKLILNIRYEMQHRSKAPLTLAIGIAIYGCVYVAICVLAGPSKYQQHKNVPGVHRFDSHSRTLSWFCFALHG
jgi:hypothetical protein